MCAIGYLLFYRHEHCVVLLACAWLSEVYVKQLSGVKYVSVKRTYSAVALALPISIVVSGVV